MVYNVLHTFTFHFQALEKEMATHSSILAWRIPGMMEDEMVGWHHRLDGHEFEQALGLGDGQGSLSCLQSMGSLGSDTTERLHFHFSLSCIGEGNGNPLQCSCLENPIDGSPPGSPVPGILQARTLEWVAISFSNA